MNRKRIHEVLKQAVDEKLELIHSELQQLSESLASESRSTSGDKHETGRAMTHLEQEKLSGRLAEWQRLRQLLGTLPDEVSTQAGAGSVILTDRGLFYISIGFGLLSVDGTSIFCLAPHAPLAQCLLGKTAGDEVLFNGTGYQIRNVS